MYLMNKSTFGHFVVFQLYGIWYEMEIKNISLKVTVFKEWNDDKIGFLEK